MPDVLIELQIPKGRYILTGKSGRTYVFEGSGAVQPVDPVDAEEFLARSVTSGCCGRQVTQRVFERVG